MPNIEPVITRLPTIPMTVDRLMERPTDAIQNYESDVVPLLKFWAQYKQGFGQVLKGVPGNIYVVANFNMPSLEPDWCRQRLNLFDMKTAHCLLGKNWCKMHDEERPRWIAVPERATYLHYNMIWDVPVQYQEKFFIEAPGIWSRVVPSGQFHLQVIGEIVGEALAVRTYSGKTFHPRWTIDNTITSTEVRRKK